VTITWSATSRALDSYRSVGTAFGWGAMAVRVPLAQYALTVSLLPAAATPSASSGSASGLAESPTGQQQQQQVVSLTVPGRTTPLETADFKTPAETLSVTVPLPLSHGATDNLEEEPGPLYVVACVTASNAMGVIVTGDDGASLRFCTEPMPTLLSPSDACGL
jgi:hypothetical protein